MCLLLTACSVDKYIPTDHYLLEEVTVTCDDEKLQQDYQLGGYVTAKTNTKWFGARVPLKIYTLAGTDSTKRRFKTFSRLGEAPVLYDSTVIDKCIKDISKVLANAGYIKPYISENKNISEKKLKLNINIVPGPRYTIRNLTREVNDPLLTDFILKEDIGQSLLHEGEAFDVNQLINERKRITAALRNNGYYTFTKDDIRFSADTAATSTEVDVKMTIKMLQADGRHIATNHRPYTIGRVNFITDASSANELNDTLQYKDYNFIYNDKLRFRKNLLTSNTRIKCGELFNDTYFKDTYNNFNRLPAVGFSSVSLHERSGTDTLDCDIIVNHTKPYSIGYDVEATNSAGDLGAAISTNLQNKNLFKGSETFMVKLRGAYESISGLEGYDGRNYVEFGGEARISFPTFLLPLVKRDWGIRHNASSEISLQYNMQNRPEFDRRVLTTAWRYKWMSHNKRVQHKFDLMEANYVYMPWISHTFKEQYLDSLGKTNAILKYNYENLLITKTGYTYTYNSLGAAQQTYGKNAYTLRFNIESSGNFLQALTSIDTKENDEGQRTFCGIAYAQYVKGDLDVAKSIRIDENNSMALHGALGIAYPYGNSNQLPFEKRYFGGGANSVRGWSVRSLGPGAYNGTDKGINFLNQSGDIKLDLSMEFRAKLFWKFSGAAFIDAGNIWTIRKYADQPGGEFRFDKFIEQIAASYGIGLRMDANFFIVRFDAGMKAINPAYKGRDHYPITHPVMSRDFAFHFAVGMPF